jgi:hypothetical protein
MAKEPVKRTSSPNIQTFIAVLEKADDGIDTAYVSIPFNVEKTYGSKGQVKVKAKFDGYEYRGVMANMGTGCHIIGVRKDVRAAIGKNVGDSVTVSIEPDTEERIIHVPEDLQQLLSKHKKAKIFFESLSYTNRKEYALWISSAKKQETRNKRLEEILRKLESGMKNPSQKP